MFGPVMIGVQGATRRQDPSDFQSAFPHYDLVHEVPKQFLLEEVASPTSVPPSSFVGHPGDVMVEHAAWRWRRNYGPACGAVCCELTRRDTS